MTLPAITTCERHPMALIWHHADGDRCWLCGRFEDGRDPPREPPVVRTFERYQAFANRLPASGHHSPTRDRLALGAIGLAEEVGEVLGPLKKHLFHGHALDLDQLTKEMGDVLWYLNELAGALGLRMEDVASANVRKLQARYPAGFDPARSQARDALPPDPALVLTPEERAFGEQGAAQIEAGVAAETPR